jgi:hypothetical protein
MRRAGAQFRHSALAIVLACARRCLQAAFTTAFAAYEMFVEFLRLAAGAKARHTDESASGAFLSSMALAVIRSSLRFYESAA